MGVNGVVAQTKIRLKGLIHLFRHVSYHLTTYPSYQTECCHCLPQPGKHTSTRTSNDQLAVSRVV